MSSSNTSNILLLNQVLVLFTITISFVALKACCINAANASLKYGEYEHDRVYVLPGQPTNTPWVSQFSGYITVNDAHGRALFYWFLEAQYQPLTKPLLLWLNGGPGCSSVGYGAAIELGPLRVGQNGATLEFNPNAWNKEANLLFVESPAGVGFSYTNTPDDFNHMDDKFVAEDTYNFLVRWLSKFPQYISRDFFIAGESYAGHYVPQLAELVYDRNKIRNKLYPHINLKGFIVGNAETDEYYDAKGYLEYAWSHSVISDQTYKKARRTCDFRKEENDWSDECMSAMDILWDQYDAIDVLNIYAPSCLLNKTTSFVRAVSNKRQNRKSRMKRFGPGGYNPCYNAYTEKYFNRRDVQAALHVKLGRYGAAVKWKLCNDSMFYETYNQDVVTILPIYTKLIANGGLKIWVYSGDVDGRVPVIGSRYCVEALQLPQKSNWTDWFYGNQVAGRIVEYKGLTYVTVRGAGHQVPFDKPGEALALIHSYLSGQPLPTHRY